MAAPTSRRDPAAAAAYGRRDNRHELRQARGALMIRSSLTLLPMPLDLSVTEAARLIGVSRARVYQRAGATASTPSRPIASATRDDVPLRGLAVARGRSLRIPLADALIWRAERAAQGLPVGPVPHGVAETPAPVEPASSVGLPSFRPF
jgi:hypothetical protein